ncbi:MAG: ATP synthase F1 subunit gamma [Oscillospiraceae bacterium]|nr:ATP synthase F1 subunit gamma [Oscillospiraceae bacterium]
MVGVKDIKRRKKTIENTMKITKAMELVAFSKLRKSKEQVSKTAPFFDEIYNTIKNISCLDKNLNNIFLKNNIIKKRCYVIIAGDKGLAGSYNGNILRTAQSELLKYNKNNILIASISKKSTDFFKKTDYDLYYKHEGLLENFNIDLAFEISKKLIDGFLNNQFQELSIIFTDFVSVLAQKPVIKKILPLDFSDFSDFNNIKNKNVIYDPSPGAVLDMIVPQYITGILYGAVVKSFASEQGSRRMAMESASKNAKEMLKDLDVMFNKARQSSITQEITEISAGARAI